MRFPRKKKTDDVFKQTQKEIKSEKKIPRLLKKEIRDRSKTESGMRGGDSKQGTKVGTLLRKKLKGERYGVKKTNVGVKLGALKRLTDKPIKPELEDVETQATKHDQNSNIIGKSKTLAAKSKEELNKKDSEAMKAAGIKPSDIKSKSDVGDAEFARNKAKEKAYKEAKEDYDYESGSRTKASLAKEKERQGLRTEYIKRYGGKVKKGQRKLKKDLIKKMTKKVKDNSYKFY